MSDKTEINLHKKAALNVSRYIERLECQLTPEQITVASGGSAQPLITREYLQDKLSALGEICDNHSIEACGGGCWVCATIHSHPDREKLIMGLREALNTERSLLAASEKRAEAWKVAATCDDDDWNAYASIANKLEANKETGQ